MSDFQQTNIVYSEDEQLSFEPDVKIKTKEDATRYAYGLAKTREEIERVGDIASAEIAKWQKRIDEVNRWKDEVTKPLVEKEEALSFYLTEYHMAEYEQADEKRKKDFISIKLPYGVTLASVQRAVSLDVIDEDAYLAYATSNNFLKEPAPPGVKWAEMKKTLVVDEGKVINKETGEVISFIKATPQERKFEVK